MNFNINDKSQGTVHSLEVSGEIDAFTAPELREKLMPLIEQRGHKVVVDLSGVHYMDSTGLGVFVGALKSAKKKGNEFTLKNLTTRVRRLFEITGLDEVITIETDELKGEAK